MIRFEVVAAGRREHIGATANPFGIEERAEVASGLVAAGSLAVLKLHGPLAAVRFFERARVGLSGRPAGAADLDEHMLAAVCPADGALVSLLTNRGRSAAIVATHSGGALRFDALDLAVLDDRRLRRAITAWLSALIDADRRPPGEAVQAFREVLDRLLTELGRCLARPLDRLLRRLGLDDGAEIVLVTGGEAALLPIHAAPLSDGRAFIDRYCLRLVPQIGFLVGAHAAGKTDRTRSRSVILADPANLGPAGVGEADRIAALFHHAGLPTPRIVERFRTAREILTAFDDMRFVHVTAHSGFRHGDPLHSTFMIGNRLLSALHVLIGQDLRSCELAFLASCESSLAEGGVGADLLTGLAAAYLEKGAATVIGALWPTSDVPAALIVDGFYRHFLLADQPPAQALRNAMLTARTRFPHPFDWAPFVVHGR